MALVQVPAQLLLPVPGAPGAVQMTLMQVPPAELLSPDVLPSDFEAALENCRPSVSSKDLKAHEEIL